jgi:3-oxoacyl-(acyl-carrier-protein) synthase
MRAPIHLASFGCLTALGDLPSSFASLCAGESAVRIGGARPDWAPEDMPIAMVPMDVSAYSRHRTFGLAIAALDDAIRAGMSIDPDGLAIVFANTTSGMLLGETAIAQHLAGDSPEVPEDYLWNHLAHRPAEVVGDWLGATGPRVVVSTACTSGTVAFGVAADLLRAGRCKRALVVGSDALCRTTLFGFRALGAYTRTSCRPFDVERDGMAIGEASAFAMLEPGPGDLELIGCATRTDAFHLTAPEPTGKGLVRAVLAAIAPEGIDRGAIDHVNAHATGTPTNDGVEALSIAEAAPNAPVSAVKGAFGHTLGAAGVVEAVILAESMRRGIVPPAVRCAQAIPGVAVHDQPRVVPQRVGVSVNLAFGGHNAALALRWSGTTERGR